MRFFRNFPEIRNFHDLRGHSCGNRRSDLIFMGGGGGTIYSVCSLSVSNAGMARHKSSQASGVYDLHLQVYNIIVLSFALFVYVHRC